MSLTVFVQAGLELLLAGVGFVIGLLIAWIIVSIPVWVAAKILTVGKARFTRAMLVTAVGPIVVAIVYLVAGLLSTATGRPGFIGVIAFIVAFIAWIGVFKRGFDTGWLRAFAIAVLATVVFIVFGFAISVLIKAFVPQAPVLAPFPLNSI